MLSEAGDFLLHAADYANLVDFHQMARANLISVDASHAARRVRFFYPNPQDGQADLAGFLDNVHPLKSTPAHQNSDHAGVLGMEAGERLSHVDFTVINGRVELPNLAPANDPVMHRLFKFQIPPRGFFIDPIADLGGFTMSEFDNFWSALFRWSVFAEFQFIRCLTRLRMKQHECLPTQVVQEDFFVRSIELLSGLCASKIFTILERLTFGEGVKSPHLFLQPLVRRGRTIAFSPQVIRASRHQRNMLKLMARTPALKSSADNLIATRERGVFSQLARILEKHGWAYALGRKLCGGKSGEIDLLAYHRSAPTEVLLIEVKAALSVDGVHEVNSLTKDLLYGQTQLRRAIAALRNMDEGQRRALYKFVNWARVERFFGLTMAAEGEPNHRYNHNEFPSISLEVFKSRLRARDLKTPARLWQAVCDRPWLMSLPKGEEVFASTSVADITYEFPARTVADPS